MLKQKKGVVVDGFLIAAMLISNPIILLGMAIFVILMIVLGYFMVGKILGWALVVGGFVALLTKKLPWYFAFPIIAIGLFLGVDPFDYQLLSMAGVNYN